MRGEVGPRDGDSPVTVLATDETASSGGGEERERGDEDEGNCGEMDMVASEWIARTEESSESGVIEE